MTLYRIIDIYTGEQVGDAMPLEEAQDACYELYADARRECCNRIEEDNDVEIIIPRPPHLTEDEALEAIGAVTHDVLLGIGNPDSFCLSGEPDEVAKAVAALGAAA